METIYLSSISGLTEFIDNWIVFSENDNDPTIDSTPKPVSQFSWNQANDFIHYSSDYTFKSFLTLLPASVYSILSDQFVGWEPFSFLSMAQIFRDFFTGTGEEELVARTLCLPFKEVIFQMLDIFLYRFIPLDDDGLIILSIGIIKNTLSNVLT